MDEKEEIDEIKELKNRVYNLEKEITVIRDQIKELEKKKAELDEEEDFEGPKN